MRIYKRNQKYRPARVITTITKNDGEAIKPPRSGSYCSKMEPADTLDIIYHRMTGVFTNEEYWLYISQGTEVC